MKLRMLVALAAVPALSAAVLVLGVSAAMASYSGDGGITVTPSTVGGGNQVTIDSSGWKASSDVTITLHSTPVVLGTVTADASGNVHATETIPSGTAVGAHTIELTGTDPTGAPRDVTSQITVTTGSGGGSLPRTGAAIAAMVGVALVMFFGGSALSRARKRAIS
jgi:5'-nucleotidase